MPKVLSKAIADMRKLLTTLLLIITGFTVSAQNYPISQWLQDLGKDDKEQSHRLANMVTAIKKYDSAAQQQIIRQLRALAPTVSSILSHRIQEAA